MSIFNRRNSRQYVNKQGPSKIELLFYNSSIIDSLAKSIGVKMKKAGINQDPRLFASRLFLTLILSIVISVMLVVFAVRFFELYRLTLLTKYLAGFLTMMIFGIIIPPIAYLIQILQLSQSTENRRIGLDSEAPAFAAVFNVFLRSGLSARYVFDYLSKSTAMQYASQIASYVNKRVKYLGESVESAIVESLNYSPSKIFNEFLTTYVTAVRTGAPVLETMEAKTKDILKNIETLASTAAENLSGIAEGFVIWLSSGFITFFLVLLLQAIFPSLFGSVPFPVMAIFAMIMIPLINLLFIWVVDQTQFRFPERSLKAYKVFYVTFPIGLIISFIILYLIKEPIPLLFIPPFPKCWCTANTILCISIYNRSINSCDTSSSNCHERTKGRNGI
ncbi:type II secretion system protein [Saccharolobus solfataricus]|uniref:Type II secretion system protein n=1 Tax=Saccharolobus solfataricus TaxID=2287 RepID=A0A157T598_SACSO|nr:type II secretion system protein [Saccharolobus solfataricus]